MHESLTLLAPLLGVWRGPGRGEYPTITTFDYVDQWEFVDSGKPFLHFIERTWDADGTPKHTEVGYLRCPTPDRIELTAALPTGQAECGVGTVGTTAAATLVIATDATVQNTPTAKHVDQIVRHFELVDGTLTYTMSMAAVGVGLTLHLRSTLHRSEA